MKIFSKEEEEEHYRIVINSGIKSGIIALAISIPCAFILNQKWSKFRQLTLPIKSFFISSIATTALVISSDNASKKYQESKYGPFNPVKSIENSNIQSILFKWCLENKWKIIGGSWVLGMIGSMSFLWKDKYLTKTQKLVQARMYAQAITLIVLLISVGLSIDRDQLFDSNKDFKNTNNNNKKSNQMYIDSKK
ncbi:hypothetical protein PNEG_00810 [Pneumocystis murina B123]|uniref:HIG1 domain-containing protein n=1 Tax=Pneumocystis murina (strain B123) TaxID=1069680 RepID=M7NVQ9_PNEMU|nr:hypothetical protein PNEG_00810 [Pneumocystis murina B123]EMR11221.1 hypothetical protein PNEG_00810 [Pneumocystis murina B123]